MFTRKSSLYLSVLLLASPLELAFGSQPFVKADSMVQAPDGNNQTLQNTTLIRFQSPPDDGKPKDGTASGGTRGRCPQDANQSSILTLLLPRSQEGLTVADHPIFFAYVPQTQANTGEFLLYDRAQKTVIYQTTFPLRNIPGIISIQYPTNKPRLEIGKTYEWRLLLHCQSDDRAADASKIGWIKRIAPPTAVARVPNNTNPSERARVYAENGIWYDALKIIAEQKPRVSTNSTATIMWRQLLQSESVKLDDIVSSPLVECCKPSN
ncbi:DUF928 domain-containing protein [Argonema galeatum]|uniref:DUF928 domain-containing protein n=1 Tax=Argonema galeatum TaxID=2942762 RepID=UPI0020122B90|nr:DUF928 domain-containing protein [Argonema galeatum]MCL1468930.1 DUF928 domain-containing protein [Argonema galeatum A003/A1]